MSELSKMSEQRSEKVELDNEFGTLSRLDWTEDGQILTVSSKQGYVYAFLTRIPARPPKPVPRSPIFECHPPGPDFFCHHLSRKCLSFSQVIS